MMIVRALPTNWIDCLGVWMSEGESGLRGETGDTGATGPPGRKVNDVDPDDDCEGPEGQY